MVIKKASALTYKEELIEQVKLLGQEVIDRAEDIVGSNDVRTSLEIKLIFNQGDLPELKYTSTHLSKRYFDNFFSDLNREADKIVPSAEDNREAKIENIPISVSQSGIPLNAIREVFGAEPNRK